MKQLKHKIFTRIRIVSLDSTLSGCIGTVIGHYGKEASIVLLDDPPKKYDNGIVIVDVCIEELKEMLPCPFCGFEFPEDLIDCVYPRGNRAGWRAGCNESMGGCTAEVLGATEEEAIQNWNNRITKV